MTITNLPERLRPLKEMALNYWWCWNQELWPLFQRVDAQSWSKHHNPVMALQAASSQHLLALSQDLQFIGEVEKCRKKMHEYLTAKSTWFSRNTPRGQTPFNGAYFCAEYGLHESLPIYSGGLGVLAGDHIKACSDLGAPMTFVGLFYRQGYFVQHISPEGRQQDLYHELNPEELSLIPVHEPNTDRPLLITVDFPGRSLGLRAWKAQVGRCPLYLLDSHVEGNSAEDQQITARLYGGDRRMRLSQEIVLGIGGQKLLKALGLAPDIYHMNEGHSCFFQLERIRQLMHEERMDFAQAKELAAANCIFTTHTPVPAGNETFALPLMHEFFHKYVTSQLKLGWDEFLSLGLVPEKSDYKYFGLTVCALKLSRGHNGVSELHGRLAKRMWRDLWNSVPEVEGPIGHITNGVHIPTWASLEMKDLFATHLGNDWEEHLHETEFWEKFRSVPNEKIQTTKKDLKKKMITLVRASLKEQLQRHEAPAGEINAAEQMLDENALTIGFARRFATYKRATLIFQDEKRLAQIVNDPQRPVQFVFAGKAHPADKPGQVFIEQIYQISRRPEFLGKIIILENYDMNISRHMVAGCDVWLNNPRRPMEASGTSGQKVPLNAGLNFSVLDGWWREGHNGGNGWPIGRETDYHSDALQDQDDAEDFYRTLSETIIPLYYSKNAWTDKAKESLISNTACFSARRMVIDYIEKLYRPAHIYRQRFEKDGFEFLNTLVQAKQCLERGWPALHFAEVSITGDTQEAASPYPAYLSTPAHHVELPIDKTLPGRVFVGRNFQVQAKIYRGDIPASLLCCEVVLTNGKDRMERLILAPVAHADGSTSFSGTVTTEAPAHFRLRLSASMEQLLSPFEWGHMLWY